MSRVVVLLRCVAMAAVVRGPRAVAGLVPFGEHLYDIALDAYERFRTSEPEAEGRREAVREAIHLTPEQAGEAVAAALPDDMLAAPALTEWLAQLPVAVRASLRRPADPAGRTLPDALRLDGPEDLLRLLPERVPRFRPGDRPAGVGNWELVELLGTGGFGEVWLARHPTLRGIAPVALKFCLDESASRVLRHEATLLDHVMRHGDHPNVVRLRQAYLDADPPCLEYEYVAGGDLSAVVRDAPADPTRTADLLRQLAEVVGHMHRLSPPVVHRDLKPSNVLVHQPAPGRLTIKVADFGIGALAVPSAGGPLTRPVTMATALRGAHTPLYASPQQRKGERADPRDDVHALGVIWYQLLVGDLSSGPPADWQDELAGRGVPAGLIALLGRCVSSRPERRPEDAAALAGLLEEATPAVLEALPAPPPRPTPATPRPNAEAERGYARDRLLRAVQEARAARWFLVPAVIPTFAAGMAFLLVCVVLTAVTLAESRRPAEPLAVAFGFSIPAALSLGAFAVLFCWRALRIRAGRRRVLARCREALALMPDAGPAAEEVAESEANVPGFLGTVVTSLATGSQEEVRRAWDVVRLLDERSPQRRPVRLVTPPVKSYFVSDWAFEVTVDGQFVGGGRKKPGSEFTVELAPGEHELSVKLADHAFERRMLFRTTAATREIEWGFWNGEKPRLRRVE